VISKKTYNEEELLARLVSDDQEAFTSLYNQYKTTLHLFVLKFIKSPSLAEDITQEVFMKIWEKREQLSAVNSFKDYLFITARNHTLNRLKFIARQEIAVGEIVRNYPNTKNDTSYQLLQQEYGEYIQRVLSSLPERTREVFQLCRVEEKSYDEVAALLGITRHAVKKHMMRSNKAFRDTLGDELNISVVLLIVSFLKA